MKAGVVSKNNAVSASSYYAKPKVTIMLTDKLTLILLTGVDIIENCWDISFFNIFSCYSLLIAFIFL